MHRQIYKDMHLNISVALEAPEERGKESIRVYLPCRHYNLFHLL